MLCFSNIKRLYMGFGNGDCFVCFFMDGISCKDFPGIPCKEYIDQGLMGYPDIVICLIAHSDHFEEYADLCLSCITIHFNGNDKLEKYSLAQSRDRMMLCQGDCMLCKEENVLIMTVPKCHNCTIATNYVSSSSDDESSSSS